MIDLAGHVPIASPDQLQQIAHATNSWSPNRFGHISEGLETRPVSPSKETWPSRNISTTRYMPSEGRTAEKEHKIEIKEVADETTLSMACFLVSEYSWGYDYPVDPVKEIRKAEYRIGAFADEKLVGFSAVSRHASPDHQDNGELWFSYAVVAPEFRGRGIFTSLYDSCLAYAKTVPGRFLSCTDNPIVERFLLAQGWHVSRSTLDESDRSSTVFELYRTGKEAQ